jgi:hypothetical protein
LFLLYLLAASVGVFIPFLSSSWFLYQS